jgi:hypothetical protein
VKCICLDLLSQLHIYFCSWWSDLLEHPDVVKTVVPSQHQHAAHVVLPAVVTQEPEFTSSVVEGNVAAYSV